MHNMHSSQMQPQEQQICQEDWGQFSPELTQMEYCIGSYEKLLTFHTGGPCGCMGNLCFNENLWVKQFILYWDHELLETLAHLHNKTLDRLQTALMEHNFIVQYNRDLISQLIISQDVQGQEKGISMV